MYKYPLLSSDDAIRILHLLPASHQDDLVEVTLQEVTFRFDPNATAAFQLPEYEALSYVWLAETGYRRIRCNGSQLLITSNCESALRHLRLPDEKRVLWVDSICINQGSDNEKSAQVQLMWQIYRRARQVIIWLGPGNGFTRDAFFYMETWTLPSTEDASEGNGAKMTQEVSNHMYSLVNNDYFRRVWTVQEVLSNASKIVVCGECSLPWEVFIAASKVFVKHEQQAGRNPYYTFRPKANLYQLLCEKYENCFNSMKTSSATISDTPSRLDQQLSIRELLNIASTHECQDPRDKVFAFRGIYHLLGVDLPDFHYGNPYGMVLAQAVRSVIKDTKSLACLEWNMDNNEDSCGTVRQGSGIPSWVPQLQLLNWRCLEPRMYLSRNWRASGESTPRTDLLCNSSGLKLCLAGVKFGSILRHGRPSFKFDGLDRMQGKYRKIQREQMEIVFQTWKELADQVCTEHYPGSQDTIHKAFLCTLTAYNAAQIYGMTMYQWHQDPDSIRQTYNKADLEILRSKMLPSLEGTDINHSAERSSARSVLLETLMYGFRRQEVFFVTDGGYFGIGPSDLNAGDDIIIFAGASQPTIVRQDGHCHRLIGNAYIYGIMNGEAWREGNSASLKTYELV